MDQESQTSLCKDAAEPYSAAVRDQLDSWLADAVDAANRMREEGDDEPLHDFRVAVRRMRSWLRLFPDLHGVNKKALKGLKQLTLTTNGARDAEVTLACVRQLQTQDPDPGLASALHLAERVLAKRLQKERSAAVTRCLRKWVQLERRLENIPRTTKKGGRIPFGHIYLEAIEKQLRAWENTWLGANLLQHPKQLHKLRIEGKRLRYALEWWAQRDESIRPLVEDLKDLQDTLGEHRDWNLLVTFIADLAASQINSVLLRAAHAASEGCGDAFMAPDSLNEFQTLVLRCGAIQRRLMTHFVQTYDDQWRFNWVFRLRQLLEHLSRTRPS